MVAKTNKTIKQTATKANTTKQDPPKKVTAASLRQVKKQIDKQLAPVAAKVASQDSTSTASPVDKSTQVDSHVPNNGAYEVLVENGKVYSTYLMWSDMK